MRVALIGLGKLGLPYGLVLAHAGHEVVGFDSSDEVCAAIRRREWPHQEQDLPELLQGTSLRVADGLADALTDAEVVLITVQTPHRPEFEGVTPLPLERADFDYGYLRGAIRRCIVASPDRPLLFAIVSTVLPGTLQREIVPLLRPEDRLVYNPSFIAMGTTIPDLLNPEFVLIGSSDGVSAATVAGLWRMVVPTCCLIETDLVTAETVKVTYNAAIGAKIAVANAVMELCHKVGADCHVVASAFRAATKRIASGAYLGGGMGDGGGCHPRDQIALSWLAQKLGMSVDFFDTLAYTRELQTEWLAGLASEQSVRTNLPVVVIGQAYKAGSKITTGSAAALLAAQLEGLPGTRGAIWSEVDGAETLAEITLMPAVFFLASQDPVARSATYPEGSVIIDPWGRYPDKEGLKVIRVGRP